MLHFVRLTGHKPGRPVIVQVSQIQAVFHDSADPTMTIVLIHGQAKMHVSESPDEVLQKIVTPEA